MRSIPGNPLFFFAHDALHRTACYEFSFLYWTFNYFAVQIASLEPSIHGYEFLKQQKGIFLTHFISKSSTHEKNNKRRATKDLHVQLTDHCMIYFLSTFFFQLIFGHKLCYINSIGLTIGKWFTYVLYRNQRGKVLIYCLRQFKLHIRCQRYIAIYDEKLNMD